MNNEFNVNSPKIPDELFSADIKYLMNETKSELVIIENETSDFIDFKDINIAKSVFKNCCLNNGNFTKSTFVDVLFDCCDFSNCDFTRSYFKRCCFRNCKLVGAVLPKCHFIDVEMVDTNACYANFTASLLEKTLFSDSSFDESCFNDCKVVGLFNECSFISAGFLHTPLKNIDFSTCNIDEALFTTDCLSGAKVNAYQAMELSKLLGLIIK